MPRWQVVDVMATDAVAVTVDATYQELVALLADGGMSAVPVVNGRYRVVGVVSEADLQRKANRPGASRRRQSRDRRSMHAVAGDPGRIRAGELMTAPAVTATPGMSVVAAAQLLETSGVKLLPVVDHSGSLVGVLSRAELNRVFRRGDDDLRDDIVNEIVSGLWVAPTDIAVKVVAGVATISGRLDLKSQAAVAVQLAFGVPGVVDVVDALHVQTDDTARRPHLRSR